MKRVISWILCLCLLLGGCSNPASGNTAVFYYLRSDTTYEGIDDVVAPESRDLYGSAADLGHLLELYLDGPLLHGLESPLPPDTQLLDHSLYEGVLTLRFDKSLATLAGIDLTVAAGCLARTFLPLTGADRLILTADSALLNGDTSLSLTLADFALQDDSLTRLHGAFTVYYASTDRRYLIGHEVSMLVSSPEELPLYLLELLLSPPEGTSLRSALPVGTRFNSATIENGLCTVDVSSEFDNRRFYAMSAQCLSLLSVVNTLTALDEIDRVEFTVDGDLLIRYGSLSITEPLVRDERCIGPVRTSLGEREAVLYLIHGSEGHLIPIPARIRPGVNLTTPELVMQALLLDPGTNGIRSCIPMGTAVNSITTANGTCVLDLNAAYLSAPDQLPFSSRVIAATLCALDGIDRVQILVNGSIPDGFAEEIFGILVPKEDWFL